MTTATAAEPELKTIHLDDIHWDDSHRHCQIRGKAERVIVDEYAEAMRNKAEFPPIIVFTDGTTFWLVDGFHRCEAAFDAGRTSLPCEIHQGSLRDAILFAVGVNATHGLPRSPEDKKRAVMTLLNDTSWVKWSDRKIAGQCRVSPQTVTKYRKLICSNEQIDETRKVERNGTIYEMKTDKIGRREAEEVDPEEQYDNEPDDPCEDSADESPARKQQKPSTEVKPKSTAADCDEPSFIIYHRRQIEAPINQAMRVLDPLGRSAIIEWLEVKLEELRNL